MEENNPTFDPALMKKKKKKKIIFDMSSLEEEINASKNLEPTPIEIIKEECVGEASKFSKVENTNDDFSLDMDLFIGKKKKKKIVNMEELEKMSVVLDSTLKDQDQGDQENAHPENMDDELDFTKTKKKKKKRVIFDFEKTDADETIPETTKETLTLVGERDYTYDELVGRIFDIMKEKNPSFVSGEKKKIILKPPQVFRAGTKKTSFANFLEICKLLHRQEKHLQNFIFTELGTSGSVDSSNHLIIKGRFQQKQIESVLRKYIKEYVACHTCSSTDTILQKEIRLFFLQCQVCNSRCSVASIKSGFQAVTSKRAAIRAKTA